jgi:hypothetical protein
MQMGFINRIDRDKRYEMIVNCNNLLRLYLSALSALALRVAGLVGRCRGDCRLALPYLL